MGYCLVESAYKVLHSQSSVDKNDTLPQLGNSDHTTIYPVILLSLSTASTSKLPQKSHLEFALSMAASYV